MPFPDAMQEFRVETSAQNAQNGQRGGDEADFGPPPGPPPDGMAPQPAE